EGDPHLAFDDPQRAAGAVFDTEEVFRSDGRAQTGEVHDQFPPVAAGCATPAVRAACAQGSTAAPVSAARVTTSAAAMSGIPAGCIAAFEIKSVRTAATN